MNKSDGVRFEVTIILAPHNVNTFVWGLFNDAVSNLDLQRRMIRWLKLADDDDDDRGRKMT